jgi:hypothetical protein
MVTGGIKVALGVRVTVSEGDGFNVCVAVELTNWVLVLVDVGAVVSAGRWVDVRVRVATHTRK